MPSLGKDKEHSTALFSAASDQRFIAVGYSGESGVKTSESDSCSSNSSSIPAVICREPVFSNIVAIFSLCVELRITQLFKWKGHSKDSIYSHT